MADFLDDMDETLVENTLRLKESLHINDLVQNSGFTFEVDTGGVEELNQYDTDVLDTESAEKDFYAREYVDDTGSKQQMLLGCLSPDEKVGDFDEVIPLLTDLTLDGKVKKLIVREGISQDVVPSDGKVTYHYVSYAEGKEGPIDSSVARGFANTLTFSSGECLEGLFISLQSMRVGEIAKFWIHFDVAYGVVGAPPRIPPRANVLFVVEMLSVIAGKDLKNILHMSHDERRELPFEKIIETVENLRAEGNGFYKRADYQMAIRNYRKGIEILTTYPVIRMADDLTLNERLGTLYNNIAQCYIQTDQPGKACSSVKHGLKIPNHPLKHKLFFKFAKAKAIFKDYEDSLSLVRKAIACLRPAQKSERSEYEKFKKEIIDLKKTADKDLKPLYQKMFGERTQPEKST